MNIFFATGNEQLNKIISNIPGVNISDTCFNPDNLLSDVKQSNADKVILSTEFLTPSNRQTRLILTKLVKETNCGIVVMIGSLDPIVEKEFKSFLVKIGVFNYNRTKQLDSEIIKDLVIRNREHSEVKDDLILDEPNEKSIKADHQEVSPSSKGDTYVALHQKLISTHGKGGKTVNSLNLAAAIANSFPLTVCVVDLDFMRPSVAFYWNTEDRPNLSDFKTEIQNRESFSKSNAQNSYNIFDKMAYNPYKNLKNLFFINGFIHESYNFKQSNDSFLSVEDVLFIIDNLRNKYECIIIDTDGELRSELNQYIHNISNIKLHYMYSSYNDLEFIKRVEANLHTQNDSNSFYILNRISQSKRLTPDIITENLNKEFIFKIENRDQINEDMLDRRFHYFESDEYKDEIDAIISKIYKTDSIKGAKKSIVKRVFSKFKK